MDVFLHEKSIELFDGNLNSLNDDLVYEVAHFLDSNNETEDYSNKIRITGDSKRTIKRILYFCS
jgi:hypothetical protein